MKTRVNESAQRNLTMNNHWQLQMKSTEISIPDYALKRIVCAIAAVAIFSLGVNHALASAKSEPVTDDVAVTHAYDLLLDNKESEFRAEISELCKKGNVKAERLYGIYLAGNKEYDEAEHWLTAAANSGDPESQYQLGVMIMNADMGRKKEAMQWIESAKEQGSEKAARMLRVMASPPRMKGNLVNVSDFTQGMAAVAQIKLDATSDDVIACFKYPRTELAALFAKSSDQCVKKSSQKFGEWAEVDPLGHYFTSCFGEAMSTDRHTNASDLQDCFKKLKM